MKTKIAWLGRGNRRRDFRPLFLMFIAFLSKLLSRFTALKTKKLSRGFQMKMKCVNGPPYLLTDGAVYDIRHGISGPQSVRICDGVATTWVLCYKPQSLLIRDDITQHYLRSGVT